MVRLRLLGLLPVLQWLRPRLNAFEIGVDAAIRPRWIVRLLRGRFLTPSLFLGTTFLALALALALLL